MENSLQAPPRRLPLFLVGVALFMLGPIVNFVLLFSMHRMDMPWQVLPILATLGVVLMAASVWQRGGVWRSVGLAFFVLLCGAEWFVFGVVSRTPEYTGPGKLNEKMPAFATTLADGSSLTNRDLEGSQATLLLFFRGRW